MSKGKKFSAAEKHFYSKKIELEKKIRSLSSCLHDSESLLSEQKILIDSLTSENLQLKDWVERLLEYTELSKDDIKTACNKDKELASSFYLFNSLLGSFGRF